MTTSMNDLLKQAKQIKEQIGEKHKKLADKRFTGEAGAGLVTVTVDGLSNAHSVSLDDAAMTENKQVLQDLLVGAINDALQKCEQFNQDNLGDLTAGINVEEFLKMKPS